MMKLRISGNFTVLSLHYYICTVCAVDQHDDIGEKHCADFINPRYSTFYLIILLFVDVHHIK